MRACVQGNASVIVSRLGRSFSADGGPRGERSRFFSGVPVFTVGGRSLKPWAGGDRAFSELALSVQGGPPDGEPHLRPCATLVRAYVHLRAH